MEKPYRKGRGAQYNSDNPFEEHHYVNEHPEGIDEEMLQNPIRQKFLEWPKKIVNKIDSPDLSIMYSVNPYQGCEHGCIYCYARNSHQYWGYSAGLDFETKLIIKKNAPQLLEKHFLQKNWIPAPISLSGNTDCYQPIEKEEMITRKLLEVMSRYKNPVGIITKNSMVLRDIDILEELAKDNLVQVYISITSLDENIRLKLEPRTASAKKRLDVVEKLSSAGIPVGVMLAPVIPGINIDEIPAIIRAAAERGALGIGYTTVRLNGSVKDIFKDWLEKNFPERAEKVWNQISDLHGGKVNDTEWGRRMKGSGNIAESIAQLFNVTKNKYFKEKSMPAFDLTKFRRNGNYNLF